MHEKKTLSKAVDSVPLGVLSGPGAPDPDLGHSRIKVLRCGHRGGHENC